MHHFVAICGFKLELQSGNAQIGRKFILTYVTLTFDMNITFVNGNSFNTISWWYDDRNIVKRNWQTDRQKELFLELLGTNKKYTYLESGHKSWYWWIMPYHNQPLQWDTIALTHYRWVTDICISEQGLHWLSLCFVTCLVSSHYLNLRKIESDHK